MNSTGNDIVALNEDILAKAEQQRFYSKILPAGEMQLYDKITKDELSVGKYVWLLWSVKEAVYKFIKRANPTLLFSPQKIMVDQFHPPAAGHEQKWRCTVSYGQINIYTQTYFHSSFLHTVAASNRDFTGSYWEARPVAGKDYETQSAGCRALLAEKINTLLPGKTMVLQKSAAGIPLLLEKNTAVSIPVSFSHDGYFLGYSLYLQSNL